MAKSKPHHGHGTGQPSPVDIHVGARVRQRRVLLGMTQTVLADALGLTFQQVQKYERGTNRISASRLYELGRVLEVSIGYFFEDMSPAAAASSPAAKGRGMAKKPLGHAPNLMATRETLELLTSYYRIEGADARKRVHQLIKALGAAGV
jgi:transcriptional regulator with XRE-family HTH domain